MKKSLLFTVVLLFTASTTIYAQQKINIKTHNQDLITTKVNSNEKWAKFPSADEPIRKILMKVTLGTPIQDTMRCADWDYSDPIYIRKIGGVNGTQLDYEIGRMLTPYGGANTKGWAFEWEVDVTDFASLLRDSVLIDYTHNGGEPGHDRGWALTVEFEFTKGAPTLEPIKVHQILNDVYPYGKPDDDIENYLTKNTIIVSPQTNMVRSRITQTGHGMDRPDNCAEFCSKWRDVMWDNKLARRTQLWRECGDNPLYPQAGTWLYDRANWCPGYLVQPDIENFNVAGSSTHTYELNMEPYVSQGTAGQQISAYLIEYKTNNTTRDVALADIVSPSTKQLWARYNPSVTSPEIVVKNNSSKTVKSLDIEYGTIGMKTHTETWKGEIKPYETTRIVLTNPLETLPAKNGEFKATITKVNGGEDQYTADNTMTSDITPVPLHKGDFVIVFEPNKDSDNENYYYLADSKGNKVFERKLGEIDATKQYTDTLSLENGDYEFRVFDKESNGLEFWANNKGGNGRVYIMNHKGELVKFFDPDFGSDIRYNFKVDKSLKNETLDMTPVFWLNNTSTTGPVQATLLLNNKQEKIKVSIVDYDSKPLSVFTILPPADGLLDLDVTSYGTGRHFVIIEQDGHKYLRRIMHYIRQPRRR